VAPWCPLLKPQPAFTVTQLCHYVFNVCQLFGILPYSAGKAGFSALAKLTNEPVPHNLLLKWVKPNMANITNDLAQRFEINFNHSSLRKLLSILLLVVFSLSLVSPLFALSATSDAGVPACCRQAGKHHCAMNMVERSQQAEGSAQFRRPVDKCPYCPQVIVVSYVDSFLTPAESSGSAELASHPTGVAQTESRWRIARDRSRQKRGPPSA